MIVAAGSGGPPVPADVGAGPGDEVDLVAAAVRGCPLVADLHPGAYGEVATYLAGRRVPGIRLGSEAVEVHVVARAAPTMDVVAAQVRVAVGPWTRGRRVDVVIEDLRLPGEEPPRNAARRHRIATEALLRLRTALEIDELPTELLVRLGTTPAGRRVA